MYFEDFVRMELVGARRAYPRFASAHEAAAVIEEEYEEFWEEVRRKPGKRNLSRMLAELAQIGAMAQRAAEDLGLVAGREDGGVS